MNTADYIASGILESYALGTVTEQERREVECMSHIYPEIRKELDEALKAVEQMAQVQKVDPPSALKGKIFAAIANEEPITNASQNGFNKDAKIIPIPNNNIYRSANRLLAAACVVMAVSMIALYFYQTSKEVDLGKQLATAHNLNMENEALLAALRESNSFKAAEIAMFRNPDFRTVFLKSTEKKPGKSLAIVCWNQKNKETVIAVQNLPEPAAGKQYQLWAMVDAVPVSIGLIPTDSLVDGFMPMKNIDNPQAFAITLENKGGSKNPTVEEMYVIGQVQ